MLSGACLCDNPRLFHAHCEQALPKAIVNFVRARMEQVFALEVDSRAAEMLGQPRSKLQRSRPPGEVMKQVVQLGLEFRIVARLVVSRLQFFKRRHKRFRHILPAETSEASASFFGNLSCSGHVSNLFDVCCAEICCAGIRRNSMSRRARESFYLCPIFLARRTLHAAANVNSVRLCLSQCRSQVSWGQSARQNDTTITAGIASKSPIETRAGATAKLGMKTIEQKAVCVGKALQFARAQFLTHAKRLYNRIRFRNFRDEAWIFIAMQLNHAQVSRTSVPENLRQGGIHEEADRLNSARQTSNDASRFFWRDITRARAIKIETEPIGARVEAHFRVAPIGDAAYF